MFFLSINIYSQTTTAIDSEGYVLLNNERFFPIGMYCEGFWNLEHLEHADTLKSAGFNTMYTECYVMTDEESASFFNHCEQIGMYNLIGLQPDGQNPEYQNLFKNYNSIIGWGVGDDADIQFTVPELTSNHNISQLNDNKHITYSAVTTNIFGSNNMLTDYTSITNVAAIEYYPIVYGTEDLTGAYSVSEGLDTNCINSENSAWTILQTYRWDGLVTNVYPTNEQITAMTYLSLIAGTKGILYYTFKDYDNNSSINITQPLFWKRLKQLTSEISVLQDVLLYGTLTKVSDLINISDSWASYWLYNNKLYIIAINSSQTNSISYDFQMPDGFQTNLTPVFSNYNNTCSISENRFYANLNPYEVQIFEVLSNSNKINDIETQNIEIFPNPTNKILFINGISENSKISIYDVLGKEVLNLETTNNQVNISNLQCGIYVLKIENENGIVTKKFIKQ